MTLYVHIVRSLMIPCRSLLLQQWDIRPRGGCCPLCNERQGALQADAGAGVGLAGVVMPRKQIMAAQNQDNQRKKRAGNVLDDKAGPALLDVERTQRLAKKAETKGRALLVAKAGCTVIGVGAEAKAIKEINLEELDNKGAQAQTGANRAGKRAKKPRIKRRVLTSMKGGGIKPPGRRLK